MGVIGALWGLTGLALMLVFAILRLFPYVVEAMSLQLAWYHWLALFVNILFMAYSEGYKGFQQGFSPRVAARARHLQLNPRPLPVLLGPLFCASYFDSPPRRKLSILIVTSAIVLLIVLVSHLSQPWRGIVDAGVIVGLGWGVLTLIYYGAMALTQAEFHYSPDLSENRPLSR